MKESAITKQNNSNKLIIDEGIGNCKTKGSLICNYGVYIGHQDNAPKLPIVH